MNILQISSAGAKLCNEHGDSAGVALAFSLGQHLTLEFDLRTAETVNGTLAVFDATNLSSCRSFYFALNNVWNAATAPLFLRTSGISVASRNSKTILTVELPDTGVTALVSALSGRAEAAFTCELGGLGSDALAVFVWQFQVTVRNRVYLGGTAPESISGDPAYLTAAQVRALLGDGTYFSSDSITFSGGTAPTATLKLHEESPLCIAAAGETFSGVSLRYGEGCKNQQLGDGYGVAVDYDTDTMAINDDHQITVPTFGSTDDTTIAGGTIFLEVEAWTRYTGTCDALTITSIANSTQESEIVVTFAGTASSPAIALPVNTQYIGDLPSCTAGRSYLVNVRNGIVVVAEINILEAAQ